MKQCRMHRISHVPSALQFPDIVLVITCELVTYKHPALVHHLKSATFFLKMADRKQSYALIQVQKGTLYLTKVCVRMQ